MDDRDKRVLLKFKNTVCRRFPGSKLSVFGSRARGDAKPESDLDVLVLLEGKVTPKIKRIIYDCAWEAGFEDGIIINAVVVFRSDWESGPYRHSLLEKAVSLEGMAI
ncbi:MAG: hypothetical protein GXP53_07455 [Deltaproteobacteria bacterium]|nr:hypothetical protein [Deltaproteobacteria bacterium]